MVDQAGMRDFQDIVAGCSLMDLPYVGSVYTWWNKRGLDPVGKKPDRVLVNGEWLQAFPRSYAKFDAGGVSDHARCLVSLTEHQTSTRKPFKFFNYLIGNEEFMPLVAHKWAETGPLFHSRTALSRFHQRLKSLKHDIRKLNRTRYGDLSLRTKKAFEDLCTCQSQVLADPTTETFRAESEAADRWHHLLA